MTLKELFEKNGNKWIGLKLKRESWVDNRYYAPYFLTSAGMTHGLDHKHLADNYTIEGFDDWEEYKPKPEMKTYYRPKQAYHKKDDCYANGGHFPWYSSKLVCCENWPGYSIDEWEERQFPARGGD